MIAHLFILLTLQLWLGILGKRTDLISPVGKRIVNARSTKEELIAAVMAIVE